MWDETENRVHGPPRAFKDFVLAVLYLYPELWKATNKRLSLDQMKALDFDELLSERRLPSP
jgi:hypothetical protein